MKRLMKMMTTKNPNTAIFTWAKGTFVTSKQTALFLKNACIEIGSDPKHVANHSMRKLLITEAIKQGMPDTVIVQLTDWKSFHSARPYINLEPQDLAEVRFKFANRKENKKETQSDRFRMFNSYKHRKK